MKVGATNMDMLLTACEQFLGKSDREIRMIAKETLEGHQRAMMGNMTVEVGIVVASRRLTEDCYIVGSIHACQVMSCPCKMVNIFSSYGVSSGRIETFELVKDFSN